MARGHATLLPPAGAIAWWTSALSSGGSTARPTSYPAEPIEALLAPERLAERIGHLHGGDPFGILEADLGGRAQPQRKAESVGDRLARIFGGQDRLRMQSRGHIERLGILVGAVEQDILRREVSANAPE